MCIKKRMRLTINLYRLSLLTRVYHMQITNPIKVDYVGVFDMILLIERR